MNHLFVLGHHPYPWPSKLCWTFTAALKALSLDNCPVSSFSADAFAASFKIEAIRLEMNQLLATIYISSTFAFISKLFYLFFVGEVSLFLLRPIPWPWPPFLSISCGSSFYEVSPFSLVSLVSSRKSWHLTHEYAINFPILKKKIFLPNIFGITQFLYCPKFLKVWSILVIYISSTSLCVFHLLPGLSFTEIAVPDI